MRIGELPEEIREIAIQRAKEYDEEKGRIPLSNYLNIPLVSAFAWGATMEGVNYWFDISNRENIQQDDQIIM